MGEMTDEYKETLLVLLGIVAGVVLLSILLVLICRRRSGTQSSFFKDCFRELGYREYRFEQYGEGGSIRSACQTTPWRASSGWDSRSYNFRHSSPRPPSIQVTNETQPEPEPDPRVSTSSSYLQVPLTVIEEED